jgi:Leucine-rich repeat (LRR) protein
MTTNKPVSNSFIITGTPTRPVSMMTPILEQQLLVACNFVTIPNLTECQETTYIDTSTTWGNTIPTEMGVLTQLTDLDLSFNPNLIGTIPSTLGDLIHLTYLGLYYNQLTGTIPSTLGHLSHLTSLWLAQNQLTGTIPSTLGNLTQLTSLYLDHNPLTGTIPTSLVNLDQLNYLTLYETQLTGVIPTTLCSNITATTVMDVVIDCDEMTCSCCQGYNETLYDFLFPCPNNT